MVNVIAVLLIVHLAIFTQAQTSRRSSADQNTQEEAVTKRQVEELPLTKRGYRPKLSLQDALQLAEKYTDSQKIDLSRFYLYEAKYILYGSEESKEPSWFFWWVNENGALGNYIEIIVRISDGQVRRLPSM